MNGFKYTPDEDIKVHVEGSIKLICKSFQSHENGLPEWIKNSSDAYARESAPETKRVIVVIFDHGRRNLRPSISCIDFSGMSNTMIEDNFRHWMDPEAAKRDAKSDAIQGGHGNGGKCYMTQMFEDYAQLFTVKNGKGCRYGVEGGSIRYGYIPDQLHGRNFEINNLEIGLEYALAPIRCSCKILPEEAKAAFNIADGFTIVTGVGPRGYGNNIPIQHLITTLQEHTQMIQNLELCSVFVINNGELINQSKPLSLPKIEPMAGAEEPKIFEIPENLIDPISEIQVSTTDGGSFSVGTLTLNTSSVSMRWKKKLRHKINFKAQSGCIGYVTVLELDVDSSYRDFIYGECHLETLEPYKQNERARLANSQLTRAVENYISEKVKEYAYDFEERDRRRVDQEEKNAIVRMDEAFNEWKDKFLSEFMHGLWGPGEKGGTPIQPPLPSGKPAKIEIALSHKKSGIGVSFRPTLKFFDKFGRQIRSIPYRWVSEDNNIAMVDEDLMVINSFSYGKTYIYAETLDGKLVSNKVPLEVVRILEIDVFPNQIELQAGTRQKLEATCILPNDEKSNSVYLVWTENNPNIVRVSASGLVFGFALGKTEVIAGDDKCISKNPAIITVVSGEKDRRGKSFPEILTSEYNNDPETGETVTFSSDIPPTYQRPQDADRHIWWINSASPMARLYLDSSNGYGYNSREWRIYYVERYIEALVQITLIGSPTDIEPISLNEWITNWGYKVAEIQAKVKSALSAFIASGELPEA